jgi:hypothetical protein
MTWFCEWWPSSPGSRKSTATWPGASTTWRRTSGGSAGRGRGRGTLRSADRGLPDETRCKPYRRARTMRRGRRRGRHGRCPDGGSGPPWTARVGTDIAVPRPPTPQRHDVIGRVARPAGEMGPTMRRRWSPEPPVTTTMRPPAEGSAGEHVASLRITTLRPDGAPRPSHGRRWLSRRRDKPDPPRSDLGRRVTGRSGDGIGPSPLRSRGPPRPRSGARAGASRGRRRVRRQEPTRPRSQAAVAVRRAGPASRS